MSTPLAQPQDQDLSRFRDQILDREISPEAARALDFFNSKGLYLVPGQPSEAEYDSYLTEFLPVWGANDWTMSYLASFEAMTREDGTTVNMLPFIFEDISCVQATTEEELNKLIEANQKRLATVQPPVELKGVQTDLTGVYNTQDEITVAKASGLLHPINSAEIEESGNIFANPRLVKGVKRLGNEMAKRNLQNTLRSSSGVRSLDVQSYYRQMGFPAVNMSNHNFGNAVDFALSNTKVAFEELNTRFPALFSNLNADQSSVLEAALVESQGRISFSQAYKIYIGYYDEDNKKFVGDKIQEINKLALEG